MLNKFIKDFATVIFAYYWCLFLINRLVGIVVRSIFSHEGPLVIAAVAFPVAFVLAYTGIWLFLNKWKARFWLKACIIIAIIVVSYMIGLWIDMNAVYNMTHAN